MLRRAGLVCVIVTLGTAGAGSWGASVLDITDSPQKYANVQVTVMGTTEPPSLDYLGESAYQLREGTRAIAVFSEESAPAPGQRVEVQGVVRVRAPDSEVTFPPAIFETSRQLIP
jgi:hypothetical protein